MMHVFTRALIVLLSALSMHGYSFAQTQFEDHMRLVHAISEQHDVDPHIMQAIMIKESGGDQSAVGNPRGGYTAASFGLMQVTAIAAVEVLRNNPAIVRQFFNQTSVPSTRVIINTLRTNTTFNVTVAVTHFKDYLKACGGNWAKALFAYNAGIGNALKTRNYTSSGYVKSVSKIMRTQVKPLSEVNQQLENN